jgi:hypothetical protein
VVDRPDFGVSRRAGGVRRVGGVLAEQAWIVGVLTNVSESDMDTETISSTNHRWCPRTSSSRRATLRERQYSLLLS